MPTSYTLNILNDISFAEFVLECCEGHIRRADLKLEPYHKDELAEAWVELVKLKGLNADEIDLMYERAYHDACNVYAVDIQRRKDARTKYEAMKLKVEAWEPPTDNHEYFKHFMLSQIDISMQSDCPVLSHTFPPERILPSVWYDAKIKSLEDDIEYSGNAHGKHVTELAASRLWLKQVEDSLK